jgi:PTH1 family peptidyl-tRNA hydrolase
MWLVVGLGNPGDNYSNSRHNIGFLVVDALSTSLSVPLNIRTRNFIYGKGLVRGRESIIIKPLTFMNRSGIAVREAVEKHKGIGNIMVIHDDLDLDTGVIRIKKTGSSGGHKGIDSIIEHLGSKNFIRLKIGIGRSARIPAEEYVLKPFYKKDKPIIKDAVDRAVEAIQVIIIQGVTSAQNMFNRSS